MNNAWRIIDRDLKPENIKAGINIYGVTGTLRTATWNYTTTNGKNFGTLLEVEDMGQMRATGYAYQGWVLGSNYVAGGWYYPFAFNSGDKYYFWGLRKCECTNNCSGKADVFQVVIYTLDKTTKTITYRYEDLWYSYPPRIDGIYEVSPVTNWLDYGNELKMFFWGDSSRNNYVVAASYTINKTTGAITRQLPTGSNEFWVIGGLNRIDNIPSLGYDSTKPIAQLETNSDDGKIYKGTVHKIGDNHKFFFLVGYDKF